MVYYHLHLTPGARALCAVILPRVNYDYFRIPVGVCNAPGTFNEKTLELFQGVESVWSYIDNIFVITKPDSPNNSVESDKLLLILEEARIKINA